MPLNYRVSRRSLLVALAGLATAGRLEAAAPPSRAPRRQQLSFGLRSSESRFVDVTQLSTYSLTLPLETGCTAIRVAVGNVSTQSYTIGGVCFCEAHGWDAADGTAWKYVTFNGDSSGAARPPGQTCQPFIVPGNSQDGSNADLLQLRWSDWLEYKTVASDRPQMLFRVLVPAQKLPMSFPVGPGNMAEFVPNAAVRLVAQAVAPGDYVTDPSALGHAAAQSFYSPLFVIQYRTAVPGIQLVVGGDSHYTDWDNFPLQSALDLSSPSLPISVWNAAWAAQPSRRFLPALDAAIEYGRPSIAVIEGWAAADGMRADVDESYLRKLDTVVTKTRQSGGVAIVVKGMPRNLYGTSELASWQRLHVQLDNRWQDCVIFDPNKYVEDADHPGNWQHDFTTDGIHPNARANAVLRAPFENTVKSLL